MEWRFSFHFGSRNLEGKQVGDAKSPVILFMMYTGRNQQLLNLCHCFSSPGLC